MPHIHQRKYHSHLHKIKRLHRHDDQHITSSKFPNGLIEKNFLDKSVKYVKYLDYPLPELLADHSTDPLQNTTRQYINNPSSNLSSEGRFKNHEMIIRRNGETTFLRPKQDLVLANGFTPVIRPSSLLPSYLSIMSHSQVSSSLSIMNKMSTKKQPEQTTIIKTKRKNRYRRKRCNENILEQNHLPDYHLSNESNQEPNFIHFFKQVLHDMIDETRYQPPEPVPLMSIVPEYHTPPPQYHQRPPLLPTPIDETYFDHNIPNYQEQNFIPPLHLLPNNHYNESFYDFPPPASDNYHSTHREHICISPLMSAPRSYNHMSGYFFD